MNWWDNRNEDTRAAAQKGLTLKEYRLARRNEKRRAKQLRRLHRPFFGMGLFGIVAIVVFLFVLGRGFLVDENTAIRAVNGTGVQSLEIVETHPVMPVFWGCDQRDAAGFEWTGYNGAGQKVDGIVCCGVLKSCTVRY